MKGAIAAKARSQSLFGSLLRRYCTSLHVRCIYGARLKRVAPRAFALRPLAKGELRLWQRGYVIHTSFMRKKPPQIAEGKDFRKTLVLV